MLLVMNQSCVDFHIAFGDPVAVVVPVAMQTRECTKCRCFDTEAWVLGSCDACNKCGRPLAGGPSACRACGTDLVDVLHYSGCQECAPSVFGPSCQASNVSSMTLRQAQGRTVCSNSVAAASLVATHSVKYSVYHIVEEPGGVDWMTEP